ncbi:hypothetical protein C8R43DRAFT_946524 [Mycena crocata]|nr:hypothetical protein C8R43DRAFT_946524 [Mycena crocata]
MTSPLYIDPALWTASLSAPGKYLARVPILGYVSPKGCTFVPPLSPDAEPAVPITAPGPTTTLATLSAAVQNPATSNGAVTNTALSTPLVNTPAQTGYVTMVTTPAAVQTTWAGAVLQSSASVFPQRAPLHHGLRGPPYDRQNRTREGGSRDHNRGRGAHDTQQQVWGNHTIGMGKPYHRTSARRGANGHPVFPSAPSWVSQYGTEHRTRVWEKEERNRRRRVAARKDVQQQDPPKKEDAGLVGVWYERVIETRAEGDNVLDWAAVGDTAAWRKLEHIIQLYSRLPWETRSEGITRILSQQENVRHDYFRATTGANVPSNKQAKRDHRDTVLPSTTSPLRANPGPTELYDTPQLEGIRCVWTLGHLSPMAEAEGAVWLQEVTTLLSVDDLYEAYCRMGGYIYATCPIENFSFGTTAFSLSHAAAWLCTHGICPGSDDARLLTIYARARRNRITGCTDPRNSTFTEWPQDNASATALDPLAVILGRSSASQHQHIPYHRNGCPDELERATRRGREVVPTSWGIDSDSGFGGRMNRSWVDLIGCLSKLKPIYPLTLKYARGWARRSDQDLLYCNCDRTRRTIPTADLGAQSYGTFGATATELEERFHLKDSGFVTEVPLGLGNCDRTRRTIPTADLGAQSYGTFV